MLPALLALALFFSALSAPVLYPYAVPVALLFLLVLSLCSIKQDIFRPSCASSPWLHLFFVFLVFFLSLILTEMFKDNHTRAGLGSSPLVLEYRSEQDAGDGAVK